MVGMANGSHLHGWSHPSDLAKRKYFTSFDRSIIFDFSLLIVYDTNLILGLDDTFIQLDQTRKRGGIYLNQTNHSTSITIVYDLINNMFLIIVRD